MASYSTRSPSPSTAPSSRRAKTCARRCERACCAVATYFPLAFVYGITTWAVWVDARIGFHKDSEDEQITYSKKIPSAIGVILYILLNTSYTIAVFTNPGSPTSSTSIKQKGRYSVLPTSEPHELSDVQTITVSSSGGARYCKKCHVSKPDRAHHCSTCKRCVLKMDHHCPWLATCLGLHNYKAFLLFLIYVSLFCWACFFNTGFWIYYELLENTQSFENFAPVNVILLAVLSGIIGLVITGFTAWHVYLSVRGQTTIECLEKTRYLSGVRRQVEANRQEHANHARNPSEGLTSNLKRIGDQVLEFHANAVPGASRFEEGEEHLSPTPSERIPHRRTTPSPQPGSKDGSSSDSPAQRALRSTYAEVESRRETDRYEEYLDEQDSSKLPNAFDLGWRRNLLHLFGPNPLLWWLPVCNTTGDGWRWEVSERWARENEEVARKREERLRIAAAQNSQQIQGRYINRGQLRGGGAGQYYDNNEINNNSYEHEYDPTYNLQPQIPNVTAGVGSYGGSTNGSGNSAVSMQTLRRPRSGGKMKRDFDTGDDGEIAGFEVSGSSGEDSDEGEYDSEIDAGGDDDDDRGRKDQDWGRRW